MPKSTVESVMAEARRLAAEIPDEEHAIERLALLSPQFAIEAQSNGSRGRRTAFTLAETSGVHEKAVDAFGRAKKLLVKVVCKDLDYCKHEGDVTKWLDDHFSKITKQLLKGAPTGVIAKILSLLGITAASWAAVVAIVLAWVLKTSLDGLCGCKA